MPGIVHPAGNTPGFPEKKKAWGGKMRLRDGKAGSTGEKIEGIVF